MYSLLLREVMTAMPKHFLKWCFQCDNLHKSNEVSCNRVSVRYKESNKEGRYVLNNEELGNCV